MSQTATAAEVARQARRTIFASMETGNFDRARLILTELRAVLPEVASSIDIELVEAYNLTL